MNAIKWIENITSENQTKLEPVEGGWGRFYAGSLETNTSCIVIPLEKFEKCQIDSGLFKARVNNKDEIGPSMIIEWNYSSDHELALLFVEDLVNTKGFFDSPIQIFKKKQEVWKDFSENDPANRLLNKLTGLWGELAFVYRNPETSFYWTGPAATDLDFRFQDASLEIKTTRKKASDEISISNLWQLDNSDMLLFMAFYRIEISSKAGLSLNDLLRSVDQHKIPSVVYESLTNEMDKLGEKFCNIKLALRETRVFPVRDDFPRITKNNLKNCLQTLNIDRIKKLKYIISVSGLETITEGELINSVL